MWLDLVGRLENPGPDSLGRFLSAWYGHSASGVNEAPIQELPEVLTSCYELVGADLSSYTSYYRFLASSELVVDGEHTIFCRGPAGETFEWAFVGSGLDPYTYEREGPESWRPTGLLLSELILYIFVSSAVFGADCGLVNMALDRRGFESVVRGLRPLDHPLWAWPEPAVRFYHSEGLLAQAGHDDGEFGYQVILAALSADKLSQFNEVDWEWDSRE